MSADNILIILQHKDKIRIYDVNFSDISTHEDWSFPMTQHAYNNIVDYIMSKKYNWLLHVCDTVDQAYGFCNRYCRTNVVEYNYTNIILDNI